MPTETALEWHRAALAGEAPPVTYEPQCGFFLRKEASGAMTPCSIWLEQPIDEVTGELMGDEVLLAECGGESCDPSESWMWLAKRPISKEEYDRRMAEMITGETEPLPF